MIVVHVICSRGPTGGFETYRVQSGSQLIVTSSHKIHETRKWLGLAAGKEVKCVDNFSSRAIRSEFGCKAQRGVESLVRNLLCRKLKESER